MKHDCILVPGRILGPAVLILRPLEPRIIGGARCQAPRKPIRRPDPLVLRAEISDAVDDNHLCIHIVATAIVLSLAENEFLARNCRGASELG